MYQFTQGLHFKPPNLLLSLSPAIQPQNQTTRPLTARPPHISVTTLLTASLSPPPHPTTHTHNPTLLTRVPFKPHNPLSLTGQSSSEPQTHLSPHARDTGTVSRGSSLHTPLSSHTKIHTRSPRQRHCLCPHQAPLPLRRPAVPSCGSSVSVFRSCELAEGKECGLAGCHAARGRFPSLHCPLLKLLVPSIPQVRRQSV